MVEDKELTLYGDSPMNDSIMAMLSPGEAVIPRSLMANPLVSEMIHQLLAAPRMFAQSSGLTRTPMCQGRQPSRCSASRRETI